MEDHVIGTFYLPVGPQMSHCCPVHTYVVLVTKLWELPSSELCPIVGDDGVWNPKPMYDVGEERYCLLRFDLGNGTSLDPLLELINCNEQMSEAPGCFL
jgi:hypothetical protein